MIAGIRFGDSVRIVDEIPTEREAELKDSVKQAQSIVGTSPGRPNDDFYPTPPEATKALLDIWKFKNNIWECACGDGAMSNVLNDYGYNVISTDKYNHGYGTPGIDFLTVTNRYADTIITNPPFKRAEEFIYHAYEIGINNMALFLKLSFLEGQKRKKMFERLPFTKAFVFSKRLTLTRNGEPSRNGGMIAYAWYLWDFSFTDCESRIGWI